MGQLGLNLHSLTLHVDRPETKNPRVEVWGWCVFFGCFFGLVLHVLYFDHSLRFAVHHLGGDECFVDLMILDLDIFWRVDDCDDGDEEEGNGDDDGGVGDDDDDDDDDGGRFW